MRENLTEIIFILDRSGSMSGLEADTVGGFQSMLREQKQKEGKTLISTVLFNQTSQVLHDRADIREVEAMAEKEYQVRGCTALLDAIGGAIHHIGNVHKYARPEDVPCRTLFVITTDGMENAGRHYSADRVRRSVQSGATRLLAAHGKRTSRRIIRRERGAFSTDGADPGTAENDVLWKRCFKKGSLLSPSCHFTAV